MDCLKKRTPETIRDKEGFFPRAVRTWPSQHRDFVLLASGTMKKLISVVLSHLIFGTLLWQP